MSNATPAAAAPSVEKAVPQEGAQSGPLADKGKKKASNRWGEKETTVLLRNVYEVKTGMGENSEAMGIAPLKKYWTMDQATRKENGLDFLMRREWYDILHVHEGDKDTINPDSLTDPGAEDHNRANSEDSDVDEGDDPAADDEAGDAGSGGGDGEGGTGGEGGTDGSGGARGSYGGGSVGGGGSPVPEESGAATSAAGGSRTSATVTETLGKRRRVQQNACEMAMRVVTGAMRDHTPAQTRSNITHHQILREQLTIQERAATMACEVMRKDIAARSGNAENLGERLEKGYLVLADAIRSLSRSRARSPEDDADG
ncbi:hypothetical protein CBR_g29382 [Chara braunii]|uniref:Uncharacterized protein n=1 Tax=Chara braunii TaxID=69332 RepID=A0A388JWS1_CHABU|nr:hypothetical protein CBR_g29382 [Chara braunii]|eukprot:GBG62182.1 hypothetical protein CBR_g29382 [Chara braunii]